MSTEAPPENRHDLPSVERAIAFVIRRTGALSLRVDSRLRRLHLPPDDMPRFDQAVALRDAEARQMVSFANGLTRYRTWNAYNRAGWSFQSHFTMAQRNWSSEMDQLGIGGCTTM